MSFNLIDLTVDDNVTMEEIQTIFDSNAAPSAATATTMNRINQYARRPDEDVDTVMSIDLDQIPSFLATMQMESIPQGDLYDLCTSIYQLRVLQYQERLWQLYLTAGCGRLESEFSSEIYWPNSVINTLHDQRTAVVNDDTCREWVLEQLISCTGRRRQVEMWYQAKLQRLPQYDRAMEESLQSTIDEKIAAIRIHYEMHFQTILHSYQIHVLEGRLREDHPAVAQMLFIRDLLRVKMDYERMTEECRSQREPPSVDPKVDTKVKQDSWVFPIAVQSLTDLQLREEFRRRQTELIQEYQSKMHALFEQIHTRRYAELKKTLDGLLLQYQEIRDGTCPTVSLPPEMVSKVDQLLALILDKVATAYCSKQQRSAIQLLFS